MVYSIHTYIYIYVSQKCRTAPSVSTLLTGTVHTNKTPVKPDIPTKSYTCMSKSWPLCNMYTAKSCKGEKRVPDANNSS